MSSQKVQGKKDLEIKMDTVYLIHLPGLIINYSLCISNKKKYLYIFVSKCSNLFCYDFPLTLMS